MNINELKSKNFSQLVQIGAELDVDDARAMRQDDLVERITTALARHKAFLSQARLMNSPST